MKKTTGVILCAGLALVSCGEAPPDESSVDVAPAETVEQESVPAVDVETPTEPEVAEVTPEPVAPVPTPAPPVVEEPKPAMQTTESGLKYEVLELGEGAQPTTADTVTVHYRGELLDGSVFDSSYDRGQPASFPLGRVIPGWTEGLQLMPVGSKYRFEIPPALAYGPRGAGPIPPNSTLIFYVELLGIQ